MVERIEGVPEGVVGLRATGKLTRDDYREVFDPLLREAVEAGDARMLFVLTEFEGLEPGAWWEDMKLGFGLEVRHRSAWKRIAVITDEEWIRKAMHMFSWLTPGELMIGEPDELEQAKEWVAA